MVKMNKNINTIKLAALRTDFEPTDDYSDPYGAHFDRGAAFD